MTNLMDVARAAYSIDEFCAAYRISRGSLYNYWAAGTGPKYMLLAGRRLITTEAAVSWSREREAAASAPPAKSAPHPPLRRRSSAAADAA